MARLPSKFLLALVAFEVAAGLIGLAAATSLPVRVTLATVLLLVLPGFALAAALFPRERLGWAERLLMTLVGSMALLIVAALLLNLTPWGLQPLTWSVAAGFMTIVAAAVALARRREPAPNSAAFERRLTVLRSRTSGLPWRLTLPQAAMFTLAGLLLGLAVLVARTPAAGSGYAGYTQLWLLPARQGQRTVTLGINSQEFTPATYRLELLAGDKVIRSWPALLIQPQQTWQTTETVPTAAARRDKLEARLYRTDPAGGSPDAVYRHVLLRPIGAPEELVSQ
jgi:uncharacterized membrane protein